MVVHSPSKPTSTPWPALLPMGALAGKPPIPIARPATLVGSRQTANLRLHSSQVSKAHALILSSESRVYIRDLNSRTKVLVNGKEVREADLREGDQVKIGRFTFRFTAGPQIKSTARRRKLPAGQLETDEGDVVALDRRVVVVGQRAGCDLVLANPAVSTTHAAIYDVNGRRYIMDLGSRSGTLVNNHKTIQVELKIGDVIDIGGTEVRYVAAAGEAFVEPERAAREEATAPAASALAADAVADADELLALESLAEAPASPKPSGQSKLFEPPASLPDDSNAPIPLEDELRLPEPKEVRERIEIKPERQAATPPEPPVEVAPEDELMAMLEEEPVAPAPAPEAEKEIEPSVMEEEAVPIEQEPVAVEPEPEIEIEPAATQEEAIPVEPEPVAAEPEPKIEIEPAVIEEETIPVVEEPVALEAMTDAGVEPQEEPIEVIEEPVQQMPEPPAPVSEPTVMEEQPIPVEDSASEVPPVAIEEPVPAVEPEPVQEVPPLVSGPEPVTLSEPEIPLELAAEPEAVAALEPEVPLEIASERVASSEPEIPLELAAQPEAAALEPEVSLEITPEPVAEEGEVVGTATANVEIVPPAEEVAQEVKEAATAFPDELPVVQEELPKREMEPAAPLVVENANLSIPIAEPEVQEILEDEPREPAAAAAPPEPQIPVAPQEEVGEILLAPPEPVEAAPPKPRWIPTRRFTPTIVTINRAQPPANFDLDDLLGEKKSPFAAGEAAIQEAPPAAPEPPAAALVEIEVAPRAVVEEKAVEPHSPELIPVAPAATQEAPPLPPQIEEVPPPVDETVDSDELALAALEELAPPEPVSRPEPQAAPPAGIQEEPAIETIVEPPARAPAPTVATTSTAIVPEVPPPASTISTIAPTDEDAADLLEELPEESALAPAATVVDESSAPIVSFAAAPAVAPSTEEVDEPAAPDVFSFGQARTRGAPAPAAPTYQGRGSPGRIPPRPRTSAPIPPRWGPLATAVVGDGVPGASPRRARKRLSVLLVLMLLAMVVAALVVWKFVLPRVIVQGMVRFDNTASLRGEARDNFQKQQLDLLSDAKVRAAAEGLFKVRKPAAAGFFVDQDFQHPQLKREWSNNGDGSEVLITYQGTDPTLDPDRLFCLLQAIYDANSSSVSTAAAATRTVDQKRMALAAARAERNKISERRMILEAMVRPDPAELSAAQAEVDKLDQAWKQALTNCKAIAADIDRLSQASESATAGAAADGDSALKLMSEKLTALNGRLAEAKSAVAKQAADARKALNASIEDFKTSMGAAQGMMKDNTALAAYVSSAQKLHEASWKLQGDLIERQEQQQKQLLEYKKHLEEQVEAHKQQMLEKDDGLKELNHLLEMKRRELNALSATGGLKRDVQKLREDVALLQEQIMRRTVLIGEDKFYQDAINLLKQIIDSGEGQLAADRAASEKLMNDLETRFRNTSPEIETLPAAQRTMAARLSTQVNVMQAARKSYTDAVQAQDADANDRLKDLQAEAASLESEIVLRRKELAAEQHKKLNEQQAAELQKKQAALAEAEKAERAARDAYLQRIKAMDLPLERDRAYQNTRDELQRITRIDEPAKMDQSSAAERAFGLAQRAAESAIAPQPPAQPKILDIQDNRFVYGTGAVLLVGLFFGTFIFLAVHSEPRHRHSEPVAPSAEDTPISA